MDLRYLNISVIVCADWKHGRSDDRQGEGSAEAVHVRATAAVPLHGSRRHRRPAVGDLHNNGLLVHRRRWTRYLRQPHWSILPLQQLRTVENMQVSLPSTYIIL